MGNGGQKGGEPTVDRKEHASLSVAPQARANFRKTIAHLRALIWLPGFETQVTKL